MWVKGSMQLAMRRGGIAELAAANIKSAGPPNGGAPWIDMLLHEAGQYERSRALRWPLMMQALDGGIHRKAVVIKGLANRTLYSQPWMRSAGDVDLHYDSLIQAEDHALSLRSLGWSWDEVELPWIKWSPTGKIYGQISMVYGTDMPNRARVDMHVGPYSVGNVGTIPLSGRRSRNLEGRSLDAPDPHEALAIMAAHAAGDCYLYMKDVNDAALLIGEGGVDFTAARSLCSESGVEEVLDQILTWVRRIYCVGPTPKGDPNGPIPPGRENRRLRSLFMGHHSYRVHRSHSSRLASAAQGILTTAYYSANLSPRVSRLAWPRIPSPRYRRPWWCWRLVPQSLHERWMSHTNDRCSIPLDELLDAGMTLRTSGRGAIVEWAGEKFVPTVWGRVSEDSLNLVHAPNPRAPVGSAPH